MNVDLIRTLAKNRGLSITKLEEVLGFGNGTIGKWTKQSPSCDKLSAVANYLSVSVDFLLNGSNESHGYQDVYVAFIDFLGFSEYVENNSFENVSKIFDISNEIVWNCPRVPQGSAFKPEHFSKLKFNLFSDTVIISISKEEERSLELLAFAVDIFISNILLNFKLLARGVITSGYFYSCNNIFFGPALCEAARLEKSHAKFPRIIISNKAYDNYILTSSEENRFKLDNLITFDPILNDYFIVNYVDYTLKNLVVDCNKERQLEKNMCNFISGVNNQLNNPTDNHILEKYIYFAKYYNYELDMLSKSTIRYYSPEKINIPISNTALQTKEKSSSSELKNEELELLEKFNKLLDIDKGRILDRMESIFESYSPEQKENVS